MVRCRASGRSEPEKHSSISIFLISPTVYNGNTCKLSFVLSQSEKVCIVACEVVGGACCSFKLIVGRAYY